MSLREMLAQKQAAAVADEQQPGHQPPPARQLGGKSAAEEVLPMAWPIDPATCRGNSLAVEVDSEGNGWLGILLEDGRMMYLLGPLKSRSCPF